MSVLLVVGLVVVVLVFVVAAVVLVVAVVVVMVVVRVVVLVKGRKSENSCLLCSLIEVVAAETININ